MEQRKIGELFKRKRTMKNLFKSIMTVAVAAMAFTGCSNTFEEVAPVQTSKFTVNAVAEDMTRTAFGEYNSTNKTYKTLWDSEEDKVKVAINATEDATSTKTTVSDDKSTASFEVGIETGEVSAPYTFAALSPASAAVSGVDAEFNSWNIEFPTTQTPTANSCDPKAQILLGTSTTYETMPSSVDLSFKHLSAYAKFSFINLNLGNATVNSVVMESEKTIAYRHYYYIADNEAGNKAGTLKDNGATKVITINTSSLEKPLENIWVGLAPTDVSNSKLTFTINTSAGTYKKEVTMPADRVFEAGKVSTFKVDMAGVELEGPVKYELLTNVANLTAGSKVIIAAAKANYAMSTNQKSSNRGAAAITKNGNYIIDPSSDVEIFTVEEGTEAGSYAFKGKDGYIYAASSSGNQLKTQGTLSANGSWKITIENAGTKLVAQGTNSHNILQYNPNTNNGSPLFNCYASTSTDRELVAIYYIPAENQEPDTTPAIIPAETAIEIAADEDCAEVALTLKNITETVNVDWNVDWIDDAEVDDSVLYISYIDENESTGPRTATFTLTANGAEATVTLTQKGAAPIVEETLAEINKDAYYTFKKATTFSSAKWYAIIANGKAATAITSTYGYLQTVAIEEAETIILPANLAFGFTSTTDGYLMQQYDGKYMYQTGTYNNFNVSTTVPTEGGVWSVEYTNSAATIKNNSVSKWIQYDSSYNSYGSYDTQKGTNPTLYELVEIYNEPILVAVNPTALTFSYEGGSQNVTATTYATATLSATSNVNWANASVSGSTITITAVENTTVETREGIITVTYGNSSKTIKITQEIKPEGDVIVGGSDDFDTVKSTNTSYVQTTTNAGWVAVNCAIFKGGTSDSSPAFKMIGADTNRAFCMNGKTTAVGTITSPTLTTGCGTLKFNYGLPFGDTKIKFRVDINQNGTVVKTFTVNPSSVSKLTKYSHEEAINVAGDFQIVFTNLSPSNSTSNKDRTAIWDVEWTGYKN